MPNGPGFLFRRIIPAYAGSTLPAGSQASVTKDHPRVCGEHIRAVISFLLVKGSSPRMRGARFPVSRLLVVFGIIPAYAGSTWPGRLFAVPAGDHPRVCGEHFAYSVKNF